MAVPGENRQSAVALPHRVPGCFAQAHRGLSSEATENTVAAFQAAAQAGFRSFELDTRLTRDGEVVVLHDAALERTTTDGNGRVAEMRYDELRGYTTPHGPIPRLDDLLAAMKGWNGVWNLEVKALKATEPTLALAQHHGVWHRCLVSSFDPDALARAREFAPKVPRAFITSGPLDDEDVRMAKDLGCAWFNLRHDDLDGQSIPRLQKEGFKVGAWTVNDPAEAIRLASRGVSCVITDRAEVLRALGDVAPYA